jgi:hypothetical protein
LYNSNFWQRFCTEIRAPSFEYAIDFILVLNAIVVGIQSWPELSSNQSPVLNDRYWDGRIDTPWGECGVPEIL